MTSRESSSRLARRSFRARPCANPETRPPSRSSPGFRVRPLRPPRN